MDNTIKFYIRAKQSQALDDAIADTVQWKPVGGCILKTEVAHTYLDINNKGILHKVVVTRRINKKAKILYYKPSPPTLTTPLLPTMKMIVMKAFINFTTAGVHLNKTIPR